MKPKVWELPLVLGLILLLCLWAFWPRKSGSTVRVSVDGVPVGAYSLTEDLSQPISGSGEFSLTLIIHDGHASVTNSTCPDLICQHHAPISRAGEQIVCLPGRVVIQITHEKEAEIDAVTG